VTASPSSDSLRAELLRRIHAGVESPLPDAEFNELALTAFRYQFACNAPYRAYCERRGATPDLVREWGDIPAVPTDAFKAAPLVCGDPATARAVFRTSGTSAGAARRGQHFFPDLTVYDAALLAGFAAHLLPDGAKLRMLSLVPPPAEAPNSSLSHMIRAVIDEFGADGSGWYLSGDRVDVPRIAQVLRQAEAEGEPLCVLGTSFAFVHLLDALRERGERFKLPLGSRVMDTGGFKGRSREVTREQLYTEIGATLGVPAAWCVNEYGMTEMSSQFYDTVAGVPGANRLADRLHLGPPWVRTRAVDPETLAPLPDGEQGVLRHWDLANLYSVTALQTEDLGVCLPGGFRVLGRARGAEARGCSLAMDELLSAIAKRSKGF
jgi:hypothetical protein